MKNNKVFAVVTVPFNPKLENLVNVLKILKNNLKEENTIIVLEERIDPSKRNEITYYLKSSKYIMLACNEFETTARWYKGIRRALDENCNMILILPGDIVKIEDENKFNAAIDAMIKNTNDQNMVVGDYVSTDPFKENFDVKYALPILQMLFPKEGKIIEELGIKKLRSEYFCIGSKIIDNAFIKQKFRWLPLDITMLLMVAVIRENFDLKRVDLGKVSDEKTRNVLAAYQQLIRFAFQTWFNGHTELLGEDIKSEQKRLLTKVTKLVDKSIDELLVDIDDK